MIQRATFVVILYACLTSLCAVFLSTYITYSYSRHFLERAHWDDASEIVSVQPSGTDAFWLEDAIERARLALPQFDFYVLDTQGRILYPQEYAGTAVDIAPIQRFLLFPAPWQLLFGSIPKETSASAIFSAAEFLEHGQTRYLYMVHKFARTWNWRDTVPYMQRLILPISLGIAGSAFIFILLIVYLSRNFRKLAAGISEYSHGNYDWPLALPAGGELTSIASRVQEIAQHAGRQERELSERSAYRQELLTDIVHDMRGPITAARGFVDSLVEEGRSLSDEFLRRCFSGMRASFEALQSLSSQLRNATVEELPAHQLELVTADLSNCLLKLMQQYEPAAAAKNVTIVLECSPDIGTIRVDLMLFQRAMNNLVENALKFTHQGGRLIISAQAERDAVRVSVMDTGLGIPKEKLLRIFERYYRSEEARQPKGYGLGLATVRRAAELHGGTVFVESTEGKGSTFTIRLPQTQPGSEQLSASPVKREDIRDTTLHRPFHFRSRSMLLVVASAAALHLIIPRLQGAQVTLIDSLCGFILSYCAVAAGNSAAAILALIAYPLVLLQGEALRNALNLFVFITSIITGLVLRFGISRRVALRLGTRTFLLLLATLFITTALSALYVFNVTQAVARDLDLTVRRENARNIAGNLSPMLPATPGIPKELHKLEDRLFELARLNRLWDFFLADEKNELLLFTSFNEFSYKPDRPWDAPPPLTYGTFNVDAVSSPKRAARPMSYARIHTHADPLYLYVSLENGVFDTTLRKTSQLYLFLYTVGTLLCGVVFIFAAARIIRWQLERMVNGIEREVSQYEPPRVESLVKPRAEPRSDPETLPESATVAAVRSLIHAVRMRAQSMQEDDALTRRLVGSIIREIDETDIAATRLFSAAAMAENEESLETMRRKLILLRGTLQYQADFLEDVLTSATPFRKGTTALISIADVTEECLLEAARSGDECVFLSAIEEDMEILCDVSSLRRLLQHLCRLTAIRGARRAEFKSKRIGERICLTMYTDEQVRLAESDHEAVFVFLTEHFSSALDVRLVREVDHQAEAVHYCCEIG